MYVIPFTKKNQWHGKVNEIMGLLTNYTNSLCDQNGQKGWLSSSIATVNYVRNKLS